ncbi:MAG TPA: PAS domain S-box protein [Kofleriaceae bacterium]|nr:PAS domain S-box protein [Kofleriaceae bacterium]
MSTAAAQPVDELLRENEELRSRLAHVARIVSIVQHSSEAIASTATDGTLLCWNKAAERLYGFTAGEAIGRSVLELVPFDRLAEHKDAVARALGGQSVVLETRRRRRDGSIVMCRVTYARLADDETGKLLGCSITAHALER